MSSSGPHGPYLFFTARTARGIFAFLAPLLVCVAQAAERPNVHNHRTDPLEWTNLAVRPEYAGVISKLVKMLPAVEALPAPMPAGSSSED